MSTRVNRWARATAVAALVAFAPIATTGCFGSFELTKRVYRFNQDVDPDKWVQWIVFLVLMVFPYGLAGLIDTVFANSVEFWTGENPVLTAGRTSTAYGPDGALARATFNADGSVDLHLLEANGTAHDIRFVREGESLAARDADGKLLARVIDVNGRPSLVEGELR